MSETRVRVSGSPVTHVVAWSDDAGGYARCGTDFAWHPDDHRTNARSVAVVVETDCDCMTCLVKEDRAVAFHAYQDVGVSVINVKALSKLEFFNEE